MVILENIIAITDNHRKYLYIILVFLALTILFFCAPFSGGDDWQTFINTGQRLLKHEPVYGIAAPYYYVNPPHVIFVIAPLSLLSFQLSFALLLSTTLVIAMLVIRQWNNEKINIAKSIMAIFSPPMFYILLHGEIDVIILGGVLLPIELTGLFAIAKPQVFIGAIFNIQRGKRYNTILITYTVIFIAVILMGHFPELSDLEVDNIRNLSHNFWAGMFPFQVPLGVYLIMKGIQNSDDKLLIAASPFLMPYATMGSFIGVWFVALCNMDNRQSIFILIVWWLVVVYRII